MIEFILNERTVRTRQPASKTLLDFIRYEEQLTGTKIGCREGDCGACTVLLGKSRGGDVHYESMTSCITPLGNAAGKHVVTVEGLNMEDLNPVQQAMVDSGGTQCGFCTVGFVVSLCGYCLTADQPTREGAISAIDGNICRCTGYKSIENAAGNIAEQLSGKTRENQTEWLVKNGFLPEYFLDIPRRLLELQTDALPKNGRVVIGGGTDLYVQKHDDLAETEEVNLVFDKPEWNTIRREGDYMVLGSAATATDMMESKDMQKLFPDLYRHMKLISSTQIRNMGTVAGNFVNASPIGDLTSFFIALNSTIVLTGKNGKHREIYLKDFFNGYKDLDKHPEETLSQIRFRIPDDQTRFNFEKVSKRTYLDIASVNTAIQIRVIDGIIEQVHMSAGGVGPIPKYLKQTCSYLTGKTLSPELLSEANEIIQTEISPISDVRGSESYKRTLLRQLFYAHFAELYPETIENGVPA